MLAHCSCSVFCSYDVLDDKYVVLRATDHLKSSIGAIKCIFSNSVKNNVMLQKETMSQMLL